MKQNRKQEMQNRGQLVPSLTSWSPTLQHGCLCVVGPGSRSRCRPVSGSRTFGTASLVLKNEAQVPCLQVHGRSHLSRGFRAHLSLEKKRSQSLSSLLILIVHVTIRQTFLCTLPAWCMQVRFVTHLGECYEHGLMLGLFKAQIFRPNHYMTTFESSASNTRTPNLPTYTYVPEDATWVNLP